MIKKPFWKWIAVIIWQMLPWPRPKRTSKSDAIADECAKNNGYFCCDYYGFCRRYLVYGPLYRDSRDFCEGSGQIVLVRNCVARFVFGIHTIRYIENLKERKYDKGIEILKRWRNGFFTNDKEKESADAVKKYIKKTDSIELDKILKFVEISDRLKMRLKYSYDGYNHYLELI